MKKISIVIGEVQDLSREILKAHLSRKGFLVVADVSDGLDIIIKSIILKPDIVLMDLELPVLDGIRAAKAIKQVSPEIKIIAFASCGDKYLYDNLKYCIDGYMKKPIAFEYVEKVIYMIQNGEEAFLDVENTNLFSFEDKKVKTPFRNNSKDNAFTKQENEVLKCLLAGMDNESITKELYISLSTVKFHVRNILRKCEVSNRFELMKKLGLEVFDSFRFNDVTHVRDSF